MKPPVADDPHDLAQLRNDYALKTLDEREADRDPMKQFGLWMAEAILARVPEPTAMTLATADAKGRPSARIVLLKGVDPRGFVFFTILWKELERQVRIEGAVEKVTPDESRAYYATRPLGSRIGAWASPQSEAIESRSWLENRWEEFGRQHGENPPLPPHWGGYRLIPDSLEFWQGRRSRLHDRIAYTRAGREWKIARLAP
jgi:pyridoxamine 5'-phosphate oxidase